MKLHQFEINRFRNLKLIHVRPSNGLTGFWGPNGQGKTNVLEALFATISGKSFRPYSKRLDWFPVENGENGKLSTNIGPIQLQLVSDFGGEFEIRLFSDSQEKGKITVFLNGKKTKFSTIRSKVPIVVFSPDDHALIRNSPEARRSFIDEIYSDVIPGYIETLERFERSLKIRNKLLRNHQVLNLKMPNAELNSFTELLIQSSFELFTIRMEIWNSFEKKFRSIASELFKIDKANISAAFEADIWGSKGTASQKHSSTSLQDFRTQINKSWPIDLTTGWTHRGPHRDDVAISIFGLDSRSKASQGQARLLALSLKWTHAIWVTEERRERPLFLIDDLSSELDAAHRGRLLNLIKELSCQVFISGTDPSLVDFEGISDYIHYRVESGRISSQ